MTTPKSIDTERQTHVLDFIDIINRGVDRAIADEAEVVSIGIDAVLTQTLQVMLICAECEKYGWHACNIKPSIPRDITHWTFKLAEVHPGD